MLSYYVRYEHFDRGLLSEENYLIYKQNIENQIKKIDEELKNWDQKRQKKVQKLMSGITNC